MTEIHQVHSYAAGHWIPPDASATEIESAIDGTHMAQAGNASLDADAMRAHALNQGGAALRAMTFHERARMVKALATYLNERRHPLYELSYNTGATLRDQKIDVDGGIGTLFVYASKARRELPDAHVWRDGPPEPLGRHGQFWGQHVMTSRPGVALHINAYNFPVWGMLEKVAPTWLAGMPAIVKPATATSYVTEACVRLMIDSGILPNGALQLVAGRVDGLLDQMTGQDVVTFTGSAATALKVRSHPSLLRNAVRFTAEQDSLNATLLGDDVKPGTPSYAHFIDEVVREMTVKSGQKCTAIRRIMVPEAHADAVAETLKDRLSAITVGDPRDKSSQMGALVSVAQRADVLAKVEALSTEATVLTGPPDPSTIGAFLPPILLRCDTPMDAKALHDTEAFGSVATIMPYASLDDGVTLMNRGEGSLVASVFTADHKVAKAVVERAGAFHGRLYFSNDTSAPEATGHGAPMPHMVHGGPGRAGGGEELGGLRALGHYMQRTAVQGTPDLLTAMGGSWVPGASEITDLPHPFTIRFNELALGDTFRTASRTITLDDIEHFAHFTGDTFYAHMDEAAAKANPFFPGRVAHGYLLLSFAAGLFVQPDPGPVLANTGLDNLRFMKPVVAGDAIRVHLTVKAKTPRNPEYGEVRWHVSLLNQDDETVATYELLTMNAV